MVIYVFVLILYRQLFLRIIYLVLLEDKWFDKWFENKFDNVSILRVVGLEFQYLGMVVYYQFLENEWMGQKLNQMSQEILIQIQKLGKVLRV